jgi:metal-sulfur cluster biosynthetic enzyme
MTVINWPSSVGTVPATTARQVWDALGTVRDPELDEPITDLKFVTSVDLDIADSGIGVAVRLRLPTYFCAPNFAYLMVADTYDAVAALPEVQRTDVRLEDHFAAEQINDGVAARAGFTGSFPGLAADELGELRQTFQRKAHLAALERMSRRLVADDVGVEQFSTLRIADLPTGHDRDALLRRRSEIGLPTTPSARVMVEHDGRPLGDDNLSKRLRFAKSVRVSIEGNGIFCRGLLATRYGDDTTPGTGSSVGESAGADLGMPTMRSES